MATRYLDLENPSREAIDFGIVPRDAMEGEPVGECQVFCLQYFFPFMSCQCKKGWDRWGDAIGGWCDDNARIGLCEERCHPSVKNVWRNLSSALRLDKVIDALRAAYNKWPAFVVFLLLSLTFSIGWMMILRISKQPGDEFVPRANETNVEAMARQQDYVIDEINGALVSLGFLVFLTTACMGCACFFPLLEGSNIYATPYRGGGSGDPWPKVPDEDPSKDPYDEDSLDAILNEEDGGGVLTTT